MRLLKAGLLLVVLGGMCATSLQAQEKAYEPGDFAPRGSLLYARINDVSGALNKLGGDKWKHEVERMLLGRSQRDFDESEPLIEEIRRFVDYMGTTEFVIGDVMVREPFVQMASVTQLKEGAPTEFSEEFRDWVKEVDDDIEITPTSIKLENGAFWIKGGLLVNSSGGMMDAHIEDVLDGFTEESLSQVERFTKWSKKANGEVVLFADMKAWRTAIDRLGEDFSSEVRQALDTVEWQKWDMITGRATLPGKTSGGISLDLNLSLNQPFEHVNAFLKPAGGSKLMNVLPAETVGFLSAQLGREHERTFNDLLSFFHDFEQNDRPARLKRRIEWAQNDLEWAEERLANLDKEDEGGNDKDGQEDPEPQDVVRPVPAPPEGGEPNEEYDPRKELEEDIARYKQRIADLEAQIESYKYRAFEGDPDQRQGEETEAEEFSDQLDRAVAEFGFTRQEVLDAIGQEVMLGIMDLPDPGFDGNDPGDAYGEMWFALIETQETFPELKERFLDRMLARKLPADMDEEQRERAKRDAEKAMFKKVEGGELIRERGLSADWCVFAGEGFVGFAPNEDIALQILKASVGTARMNSSNIPGGVVSGSKCGYIDLGKFLGKISTGIKNRRRRYADFPLPDFRLDKFMAAGLHLTISSDESSQGISFSLRTGGVNSAGGALEMFANEFEMEKAKKHDERELRALEDGIESWISANRDALKAMEVSERNRTIKAVTPESLAAAGSYVPRDGLRSAFDPAMADRFKAMLDSYGELLGAAEDSEGGETDLSESSFVWFGLPTNLASGDEEEYYGRGRSAPSGTPICALKGDWARGGRFVMIWAGGPRVVWYDAADYASLMDATRNGKEWTPTDITMVKPPKWRVRKFLRNKRSDLYQLRSRVANAREAAAEDNRDLKLDFKGKDKENATRALRELLGLNEDDWFYFEDAKNLTITTDAEGKTKARYENWGHWVEIDEEGEVTSSLDE